MSKSNEDTSGETPPVQHESDGTVTQKTATRGGDAVVDNNSLDKSGKSVDVDADSPAVVALKTEIKRLKASGSSVVHKLKQAAQSHKKMMTKFKKQREERKSEVGGVQANI